VIRFFTQAFKNYRSTGALVPSSRVLARTIVQSIPDTSPKRVLEIGCGTGAFTKEILKELKDGDTFDIVELNLKFCEAVESTLLKKFRDDNQNIAVVVHNAPIEEANLRGEYDAIICGLPFNNFSLDIVQHIFDVMLGLLKPNCELAYFEYLGVNTLKRWFGLPKFRRESKSRSNDIQNRYKQQSGSHQTVWRNIPSCRVIRLKK
jgi:phospholipid N-methyltransferase